MEDEIFITHFETEVPECCPPDFPQSPPGDFGANLQRARWERDLSLRQVADAVGMTRSVLNRYEMSSRHLVRIDVLYRLCRFYGKTADELLGFGGRKNGK